MRQFMLAAALAALLVVSSAQDLDAILDECEDIGYRAGGFAVRAACAIMISNCPVPFIEEDDDFGSRSALADGFLSEVVRSTCQITFRTSCVASAFNSAYARGGDCQTLLDYGPDLEFTEEKCPDHDTALKLFQDTADSICNKSVPDIKPAPPPKKEDLVSFSARGSTGVEIIGGIQLKGNNRLDRVIPLKCGDAKTGQLNTFSQDCTAAIPSEVQPDDVRELRIIFSNPYAPRGEGDRNIFIDSGEVWFGEKNIWRSAVDTSVRGVLDNDGGQLDALREGRIYWKEGLMLNPPSEFPIWLEARGATGEEELTISVETNNGSKQSIPIQCSTTGDGKLLDTFQVCTGEFNGNRKDAKRILIDFNYENGTDRRVFFKHGRLSYFGVNALWKAENKKIGLTDIWDLRAGTMKRSGNSAVVDHKDYQDE